MGTVREAMSRNVYTIKASATVRELASLLTRRGISGVPVLNQHGHVVGIATKSDITLAQAMGHDRPTVLQPVSLEEPTELGKDILVREIMNPKIHWVPADATLAEAARRMAEHGIHHLLVSDEQTLSGILSTFDLVRAMGALPEAS